MNHFEIISLIKKVEQKDVFALCIAYFKMCQGQQFTHLSFKTNYTKKKSKYIFTYFSFY